MNNFFAQNLVHLRKESGMTQEKLASLIGVSFQAVSKWENGQAYPDIELIPSIASIFKVSIDVLLGYQAEKINTTHYEEKYLKYDCYWGSEVWSGCYDVLKMMPPTRPLRILDIGCGEGQAAVFFARNGYLVSAFDIAETGIEKGKALARRCGVEVDFFQADVCSYKPETEFDIIFSSGVLQYIPPQKRKGVLEDLKEHTAPDGIHVMNVFVKKPFIKDAPDWEEKEFYWHTGELFSYYSDWKFEVMQENIFDCNSSGIKHQHCMDVMMARKVQAI